MSDNQGAAVDTFPVLVCNEGLSSINPVCTVPPMQMNGTAEVEQYTIVSLDWNRTNGNACEVVIMHLPNDFKAEDMIKLTNVVPKKVLVEKTPKSKMTFARVTFRTTEECQKVREEINGFVYKNVALSVFPTCQLEVKRMPY